MSERYILLVEDNPDDEELTLLSLRKNNLAHEIVVVRDGVEAIDYLFANGAYVGKGPDVTAQLSALLPAGSHATLEAIDGSLTSGVQLQLQIAPKGATHYVVSAGGNDALHYSALLGEKASSVAEALGKLAAVRESFTREYRTMLDAVTARGLPVAVCTIYDAQFPDPNQRRQASLGLNIFNDCITREAALRGLALIAAADGHPLITPRIRQYLEKEMKQDESARNLWLAHWTLRALESIEGHLAREEDTGRFCHRDAPRAREPETRLRGTFEKASSAIAKMIGMTANPIAKPTTTALRWS